VPQNLLCCESDFSFVKMWWLFIATGECCRVSKIRIGFEVVTLRCVLKLLLQPFEMPVGQSESSAEVRRECQYTSLVFNHIEQYV
jgi:hypothetical protein